MASARAVALEVVGVEQIPPLAARPAVEEVLVVVPDPTLGVGCGQGRTGAHLTKGRGADQLGPSVLGDGDGEPVGQSPHLALDEDLPWLQVRPDRIEHHPRHRGRGAGGGGCAGQLSLDRSLVRSGKRLGHAAVGQHDPWYLPAPQLPFIVLPALCDDSTEVPTFERGPGLNEIEEEHVLGLGQLPAAGRRARRRPRPAAPGRGPGRAPGSPCAFRAGRPALVPAPARRAPRLPAAGCGVAPCWPPGSPPRRPGEHPRRTAHPGRGPGPAAAGSWPAHPRCGSGRQTSAACPRRSRRQPGGRAGPGTPRDRAAAAAATGDW